MKPNYYYEGTVGWNQAWDNVRVPRTYNEEIYDLLPILAAHLIKRHMLIVDEHAGKTIPISGNIIQDGNVQNLAPILMCRIELPAPHYQTLIPTSSEKIIELCDN